MGNLVFQATLGGQVNLVGPNTASTYNINVPTVNGNIVTTGDTGTVTNTMCATSVYTAPGTIGSGTPNTGAFTTLSASSTTTLSGGTANGVAYLDGSKVVTTGSALTFDGTNFATIGSITSGSDIFVKNGSGGVFTGSSSGDVKFYARGSGGSVLLGNTTSGTYATLDSSGNLGLGVTPSAWGAGSKYFDVGTGGVAIGTSSSGTGFFRVNNYYTGTNDIYKTTNTAGAFGFSGGNWLWYTAPSGTAGNAITFTQAMTLDASGNLLVGTTTATYSSSGRGVIEVNGSSNALIALKAGGTSKAYWHYNGTDVDFLASTGCALKLYSNGNLGATLDTSGRWLVNTTSAASSLLRSQISYDPSAAFALGIFPTNSTYNNGSIIFYNNSSTVVGYIYSNGSSTTYSTSSDYRLKDIAGGLTGYKERLLALQPKQGSWKIDGSEFRGFLAHEFAESYPSSVNGQKDAVDADGNPQYQGMQAGSSEVIADLVAYIKELETRLAALENK